jgi:acyl-CoA hydrolase
MFSVGSPELMGWLDRNAAVEMLPVEWTNDPRVVRRNPSPPLLKWIHGQAASGTSRKY